METTTGSQFRSLMLIVRGSADVFQDHRYQSIALTSTLLFFFVYLLVPAWLIPGNSLAFELSLLSPLEYALLFSFALLTGVSVALEVFIFRRLRREKLQTAGKGSVGVLTSLVGGTLAAASCACSSAIFLGIFGLGASALFLATHQLAIIFAMFGVGLIGLYFSARRASGLCATCSV